MDFFPYSRKHGKETELRTGGRQTHRGRGDASDGRGSTGPVEVPGYHPLHLFWRGGGGINVPFSLLSNQCLGYR